MGKLDNENNPQVNLREAETVRCEKCGCKVFSNAFIFKSVPAIYTGEGKPGIIPIPVFQCTECGHVPAAFIPNELKDEFCK